MIKKFLKPLCLSLCLFSSIFIVSFSTTNVQAKAEVIDLNTEKPTIPAYMHYPKEVNTAVLNVRRGPGMNKDIIGSVYRDEEVIDQGDNGDNVWVYISYNTSKGIKLGWVARRYLTDIPC